MIFLKSVSGIRTLVFKEMSTDFESKISLIKEGSDYEESAPEKLYDRTIDFKRFSFNALNLTKISWVSTLDANSSFLATLVNESRILAWIGATAPATLISNLLSL